MSKKAAFTMVELIFVIVILGILAAVAVPKLNASREDAKAKVALANLRTLYNDIQTYYAAQGEIPKNFDFSKATSVPLEVHGTNFYNYKVDDTQCVLVIADAPDCVVIFHDAAIAPACEAALQKADFLIGVDRFSAEANASGKWCKKDATNLPQKAFKDATKITNQRGVVLRFFENGGVEWE